MNERPLKVSASTTNAEFSTLVEILRWRALNHPDQKAYTFFSDREEEHNLTYAELDRQARAIGAMLQKLNAAGERILLLYPSGLEYVAAFFGCLYAGAIAVPAYPPRLNRSIERLWSIVTDAQAKFVLTTSQVLSKSQRSFSLVAGFQELQWLVTDRESINENEVAWQRPQITESTLAFLQYTSGSTAAPKGVMVSHSNLISNHRMLQSTMAHPPESPFVSWLPLFHDMGLILKMLQALYMGSPCILFPSSVFIRSPFSWLQTISLHQAYSSGAPNFAYDLCVQKITPQQRDTLDLRSWKVAFCGAEPVRYQTLLKFAEYFAPCGFRAEALRPAYGLAEATLFVTGHPREQAPVVRFLKKEAIEHHQVIITAERDENSVECTSCGSTELDARVVIVDPKTCTLSSPGAVGEVWVAGSHVAQGYWKHREETEKTFRAFIQDTQEGPFLRTGDLGFISEGSLFITGRLKDLIIIRGQNYYPQDIENTAELSHSSLKRDASAAFSLEVAGKERVILVMEIDRQHRHQAPQEIFSSIRQAILEKHDLHIDTIVLIKPGSILKTSSGKIQRRACRKAFLEQSLAILFADLSQAVKDLLAQQHDREVMPIMQPVQSTMVQSPLEIAAAKGHSLTSNPQNRVEYTATSNYSENKDMQFSLLYFSSNASDVTENKYELLLAGAKFADQHDFTAVWVPERHFHPFGGLYPNPSVLASALAVTTQRIRLRAGSVVLPMHHPVRVAEEWSVVDNLSSGRVDLAFAIGWNPNDFVLAPTQYEKRKDILFSGIEMFQKLWHGDEILLPNGLGKETAIKIYPLPVQSALTPWITCTGSPERFREAGAMGANVLTALLFQSQEELAEKIHAYRLARAQHGHDPATGHVTLMLHTFIGEDMDEVRQTVRPAFIAYLKSSVDLWRNGMQKLNDLMPQEQEQVLSYAFERYFQTHALFGTPQTASKKVEEFSAIGVNEIACLIDFGIDVDTVMDSLHFLNSLRKRSRKRGTPSKKHVLEPKNIVSLQKAQRQQIIIETTKDTEENKSTFCQSPILQVYNELEKDHNEQRVTYIEPDQSFFQQLSLAPLSQQLILLEQYLQQQIAQVLERPTQEISSVLNIRSLGLDSLMIMSIVNNCQRDLLITLDAGQFYEHTSFRSLALYIAEEFRRAHPAEKKNTPIRSVRPLVQRQEQPTIIPASFAQQRLWFLHQLQPNATAYNVLILLEIKGDLVVDALEWSLKEIIRRHESLRTSLILHEGRPVQIINQTTEFQLSQISLNYLPAEARELEVHRLARQESQCPFDLAQGSLIRAKLLLINPECYVLLLSCHHVVMDGWSRGILLRELQTLYRSHIAGLPSPLEELPIQYADFTLWQRQWLSSLTDPETLPVCAEQENHMPNSKSRYTLLEKQLLYWKTQLAGPLPLLALPTDHPRPAVQTFHGAHLAIQLPETLMDDLKTLSKREGVTLFMTLLASFQVLLARYSGQEDILVGTPIAGRNQPEIEPLIGFFVNTLVLRTDLSGNPTFEQVLHRVRQVCLGAYAHQEVPFEQVVDTVHPIRDLSRHPLFQVMFVLEEASWWLNAELPGVSLQQLPTESGTSIFDLTCSITSQGIGEIEYNTDLFEPQTITRLIDHWQTLLKGIITDPQTRLSDLPLLTAAEREQLLVQWNVTQADYPREVCVYHLFEQQVKRMPDEVALVFEDEMLTYDALNRHANQLAHYLQELGVGPEGHVGICMERSIEMVVGLLAVLKSGGAYIPLDPTYPQQRLAFLVADSGVQVVLIHALPEQQWLLSHKLQIIDLSREWQAISAQRQENLHGTVVSENLAYVIYTSGSTGKPKGVMVRHRNVVNFLTAMDERLGSHVSGIWLAVTSICFDISVLELFWTLTRGMQVVIHAQDDERLQPPGKMVLQETILEKIQRQGITHLQCTPSQASLLLAESDKLTTLGSLWALLLGGEALSRALVKQLDTILVGDLYNMYGPTETTIWSTMQSVEKGATTVSIGRPLANTQVYILDKHLQVLPIGGTGELFLGGQGVVRGYLNHPELTAERFLPDPFSSETGALIYRTGDRARYLPDGTIEFLGRIDQQVKLRGYRIELGEIEAVLVSHPAVQEGVVLAREDVPGGKQLVAYVVGTQELTTTELRSFLQEKLPAYMIPSQFLLVDELPLTPNGKLDRKALPAPQVWDSQAEEEQQGARTGIEEVLVDLWSKVLGRARVGIHDHFFELGGHSLLATQLLARVRAVLGVELAVRVVFEAPTVAAFAQRVEQALRKGEGTQIPALVARARPKVLPLSFAQQRLWFLDQLEPGNLAYLIPGALCVDGQINVQALEGSLQELIDRHESLRTTFEERDGQPVQVIHLAGPSCLPVIDLQGLAEEQREQQAQRLASQERQHPCDLTTGPLLRTYLLRLEQQEHMLLLTLHHIVTDGWSNGVLMRELTTLYQAKLSGEPSPLAPLPLQYADYAFWQREWLQGETLDASLSYWRSQLAGIAPLELPTDHPRPPVQTYRGASQELQLSPVLSEQLVALSEQQNVTLFMLLLTAFQVLLARHTGQRDVAVGSPIANRRHAEIEGVIGFFVNTLVLRTDLSGDPTFDLVLQRVREVCLGAYAHQDLPFEKVVEELEPQRDLSRSSLFQVMLVLQNTPSGQGELAGVRIKQLSAESQISKFDLTLSVVQTGQGLRCWLEYNTDLFEASTITRMLLHWQTLLEGVVHHPQARVSNLPLLTAAELEQLLVEGNATQTDSPDDVCVHQLFEQQVERTPDAVALVFEEQQLTYGELNRRANQLAHYLQGRGVGPEVLVGLRVERSLHLLVGILGILKAGGAYVPFDLSAPPERLAFLLQDTQLGVLVTEQQALESLPSWQGQILCLDRDWPLLNQEMTTDLDMSQPSEQLAYVIYTSGSTGQPKGVQVSHANVVRLFRATASTLSFSKQDIWTLFHSSAFDFSVWEIWGALLFGGRLIVVSYWVTRSPDLFYALLNEEAVTILNQTPSAFQSFMPVEAGRQTATDLALRLIIFGGEALNLHQLIPWWKRHGDQHPQLVNMYGITETTVHVTACLLTQRDLEKDQGSRIGWPLSDLSCRVLTADQQLVPRGIAGELFVGGLGVTRGYLHRPELTAERFVPDPWSGKPGARLYRTGDLVRLHEDASIQYLGRVDHQVKIRGYRIELGEIEAVLASYPAVQEAVVLAREDLPGEKQLVAYVIGSQELTTTELRSFLQEKLPAYMIPSQFLLLDAMPLTPNGKLDRLALPAPQGSRPDLTETFVAPQTPVETTLATIWSQVLRVNQVGLHDNFFALGGDSILSLQVVARAKQAGLHLTPRQLFQYQSIVQLSAVVTTSLSSHAEQARVTGPVPLTPIQHWFFARHLPEPHHFNQAMMLESSHPLSLFRLEQALMHLVEHHEALRLRFVQQADGDWLQDLAEPVSSVFLLSIDLSGLPTAEQLSVVTKLAEAAQRSLDLGAGLLLRALCLRRGSDVPDLFLLVIHHLAVDGVSWRILLEDLEMAYGQLSRQEPVHLAQKTTSWQHWATLLRQYAHSESVRLQLPSWLALLDKPVPPLPVDLRGGSNTVAGSAAVRVSLSVEQTRALLQEVPRAYHTQINDVLLSALVQAFDRWTGQPRLLVDLEGHGREDVMEGVDLSRTVGWFTTLFPVLLEIEQASGPGAVLKAIKEQLRQIPQKGLGYGLLRSLSQETGVAEQLALMPQAEVAFNYLGQFDASFTMQSLFHPSALSTGATHSPQEQRSHLLEINGSIVGGQLHLVWQYSRAFHYPETIQQLASGMIEVLSELIVHCQSPEAGGYTPSDFPLAALSQYQLDRLLQEISQTGFGRTGEQIEDIYSLSPLQAGLLFHSLYTPEVGTYCVQIGWTIEGDLDEEAWQQAWQYVINRHPILRTFFVWQGLPQPLQVVCRHIEVPLVIQDWRSCSAQEQQRRLEALRQENDLTSVDIGRAPLLRLTLARLREQTYAFHLSLHHLIIDGWSLQLVLAEVQACYHALRQGKEPNFSPVRPYRDYIAWVHQQEGPQVEQFWRRYLRGFSAPTRLPGDVGASNASSFQAATQRLECSAEVTSSLQECAQHLQLTLNTLLQGAWALLLSCYSGEPDVLFGATTTGRPAELPGVETMVGVFINTLPVRVRVRPDAVLSDWLHQLQTEQAEARSSESTSLVQIQACSEVPAGQALFESLMLFQNYPVAASVLEAHQELAIRDSSFGEQTHYPLLFKVIPTATALILVLQYDPARFESPTITRILQQLQILLQAMVDQPNRRLGTLSLLSEEEKHQLLVAWNATQVASSSDMCIHEIFEQQVERMPDAVALVFEGQQLTYGQLNRRANQLAHYLQKLGVRPEVLVGICMQRSLEMVIGLLGVLKAGGAYVPLDPSSPRERLAFMVQDAHLSVLLIQQQLQMQIPLTEVQVIVLEDVWEKLVCKPDGNPLRTVSPENLAYVIYTSGSTGVPKGVLVPHVNVDRLFTMTQAWFQFHAQDTWTLFHSCAFDFSVWEIWGALLHGGRLVVVSSSTKRSPDLFSRLLRDQQVTVLNQTPSAFRLLMQVEEENQTLEDLALRLIIFGGEALDVASLQSWVKHHGDQRPHLVNMYGITETTVHVTSRLLSQTDLRGGTGSIIGRAIADLQLYVLDTHCCLVPIGVPGELYIGGSGLARGYWHRPELTAERFIPHPWSQEPGARLYRTGDLVRYHSDGNLEYLGRVDQQVKIRGYRIELGEIAAALQAYPAVQEAVVLAREDVPGEKRLVAYVVGLQELTAAELRSFLQEKLPAYMIPSQVLCLDTMPLTPNGKLDRLALPAPEEWRHEAEKGRQRARTAIEEVLMELWSKVLGCAQMGIHDTFFELGGHSLLATQLLSRVRAVLGIELPVRAVFEAPTVATFAQRIEQALCKGERTEVPSLVARARPEVLPLSFAQQRLWFLDQLEPGSIAYLVPSALRVDGKVKVQVLERSFQELIHRHESLRTTFEQRADQHVQVIHSAGPFTLPIIDLQGLEAEQREQAARLLASQERQRPCHLATGPLLRTSLLRLEQQEHVLLLTLHHIITDGWSNGVLMRELTTLYQAFLSGQPSPLVPLPIQYADYALWQREWLQGEVLQASLSYWRSELTGIAPLELPTDHPRPPVQMYRGASQECRLSPVLSEQLVALSEQQNVTLFMLLLAAFQVLLARYTGQRDIAVGSPIANRRHAEIEGVIGFFVNTLVLRTNLSGDPTFDLVLQRVREVCLGAYAHQDLPFEKVVEELEPQRDLSRSPLFQVMLVLQNIPSGQEELAGVSLEPISTESQISKFDLTLSVVQTEQGLRCWLEYNTDLFEAGTITRMLSHWQTLLEGVVHNPQARVSDVALLTTAELEQLLVQWNATQADYPREVCVHHLFEQQVERTPDAVALVFEDEMLTYDALNRHANQLAHYLQELGVGPEGSVGICMERSIEMVVGLLAVLKAGGAYIPLDPTYPQQRLAFLVADSGVQVVLIHALLEQQWLLSHKLQIIDLGREWQAISAQRQENVYGTVVSENLAYVIYTSGSTGKPKGVMVRHRNVVNFLSAMDERLGSSVSGIWLAVTSICFDISVLELFWTLTRGMQVVIHAQDDERLRPPGKRVLQETILEEIQRQGITHLQCTPSQASLLLAEPDQLTTLGSLRALLLGGEALPRTLVKQLDPILEGDLYNMYGPTETTIWSTMQSVEKGATIVSIGRPIANTQVYLLDKHLQVLPIGGAGELFLGGQGVVRGYLNHPELTAERFLPDPFSGEAGALMYRTGDRARYLPDGTIEFLGRIDQQVKLRGYRIELGEIEAVLGSHPAVQEGVVLAREDVPGDKQLVAYVVGSQELTAAELRSFLQEKLPAYMIPNQFLHLDAIPLTPNGKLDRKALPLPASVRPELEVAFISPRTPAEEVVVGIWTEILGVDHIGLRDNFFELGGHSLRGVQVISRLRDVFQVELPLRSLFERPTVESLVCGIAQLCGGREIIEEIAQVFQKIEHLSEEDIKDILYN